MLLIKVKKYDNMIIEVLNFFYRIHFCISLWTYLYVYAILIKFHFIHKVFSIKSPDIFRIITPLAARPMSVIDYAGKLIRQRLAVIRTQHADPVSPGGESACAHMISRKPASVYPLSQTSPPLGSTLSPGYICWIHTHAYVTAVACTLDYPMGLRTRNAYEAVWHIFGVRESNSYYAMTAFMK